MTDEELVRAFEAATLSGDAFPHEAHVRVAWYYLQRHPILMALVRFREALQRFAAAQGKSGRYHETITVAYMLLVADRLDGSRDLPWPAFAERHADLLARTPSVLSRFYSDEILTSDRARAVFVMPDWDPVRSLSRSTAHRVQC
jgi:hypothetical protein